ncbi:MAG: glycosyltransferase [Planctomycetota bacterium]
MAFEMETEGHHPGYVRNFAQAWVEHAVPGQLDFVVTPLFYQRHANVVEFVQTLQPHGVRIQPLSDSESAAMERISYLRYFKAWEYFCDYAKRLHADHALLMYSDFFQLPAWLGRSSPVPYSAIYFRPTFHYRTFQTHASEWREAWKALRKRWLLARVLKDPQLSHLYCLDELAVDYIGNHFRSSTDIRPMADSFTRYPSSLERQRALRDQLGIEAGRTVFCLLGVLDRRKGVRELLECLPRVPAAQAEKLSLLLLGRVSADQAHVIRQQVEQLNATQPLQVIQQDAYVPDHEVQHYYDLSDVILATYQRHMGSSSALIRAALAGKPVIASNYGLVGERVRRYRLGLTVDTENPAELAAAVTTMIREGAGERFDAVAVAALAQAHSPTQLAEDLKILVS